MAAPKKTTASKKEEYAPSPRVTIMIPKVPGQKVQDDYLLSVDGERFQIQRGVEVTVPRYVAEAIGLFEREKDEAERIVFEYISG